MIQEGPKPHTRQSFPVLTTPDTNMNLTSFLMATTSPIKQGGGGGGIISDFHAFLIDYSFGYISLLICLVGVTTNFINIKTFLTMGVKDGTGITLLGLSCSDLGFTFCGVFFTLGSVLANVESIHGVKSLPIQPRGVVAMYSVNVGIMFYVVTCLNTTFLAVSRCICVAMPFKFKHFITRSRSIFALIVFSVIAMSLTFPVLNEFGLEWKFDPLVNKTRIVLWMSSMQAQIKTTLMVVEGIIMSVSSVVVGVCAAVMAKFLRQSVQFRKNMTSSKGDNDDFMAKSNGTDKEEKLSGKELHVVRQVIFICVIYSLSTFPMVTMTISRFISKEVAWGGRYYNTYAMMTDVTFCLMYINSASTFFVYYVFNSKFRSQCKLMTFYHCGATD